MRPRLQRQRDAEALVQQAVEALVDSAEALCKALDAGRLVTRPTPEALALATALARLDGARVALRESLLEEPYDPPPLHAFAPDAAGNCLGCGKTWAGGHPASVAPPLDVQGT